MSGDRGGLEVSEPIALWHRPLDADFSALFKSLTKASVGALSGNWAQAGAAAADALVAVGFGSDPGQLAWLLIHRALATAIFELVGEKADLLRTEDRSPDEVCNGLGLSLGESELCIDRSFLDNPRQLPILDAIKIPIGKWLVKMGVGEPQAEAVCSRLDSYFVFALSREWRRDSSRYEILRQALDTPFGEAEQRELAWLHYSAWLERQIDRPLFNEAFGLRQIYVPPRAYYEERVEEEIRDGLEEARAEMEELWGREYQTTRCVVDLTSELDSWIDDSSPDDAVRIISGGPGSGKSSLLKMFAASTARRCRDLRVLFVPLHHLEPTGNLLEALETFAGFNSILPDRPVDPSRRGERYLIIFDGLDELTMQGKEAQDTAQQFLRNVDRTVSRMNAQELRLQVLMSGRELVVQANASAFGQSVQLLHLLPYAVQNGGFRDPIGLLKEDQRDSWWQCYGLCVGRDYPGLPADLSGRRLFEITAQPLLNYLLALSYQRGINDFSNLNIIYADLISAVYERTWAGRRHPTLENIDKAQFVRILEEIGMAAWHGSGRRTTVREIEKPLRGTGLKPLLKAVQQGAETGVARLLIAFYFRQHGRRRDGEKTFEFTHRSFGEYLAAQRIVRAIARMHAELERRREDLEGGWDERQALAHWATVCGPVAMESYLFSFLCDEFQLRGASRCGPWQRSLIELLAFVTRHGLPMEKLDPRPPFRDERRLARNAEEALIAATNACARVTGNVCKVPGLQPIDFRKCLSGLFNQRFGPEMVLARSCLGFFCLDGQSLSRLDLHEADLSRSTFDGADLRSSILGKANLRFASLRGADLRGVDLREAQLAGADLSGADLREADLQQADLGGANLSEADLRKANMLEAKLVKARLRDVVAVKSLLGWADLAGADLAGANLAGADLTRANLREAKLAGADLRGARVLGADFRGADLRATRLETTMDLFDNQIREAHGDDRTQLPARLHRPAHWS